MRERARPPGEAWTAIGGYTADGLRHDDDLHTHGTDGRPNAIAVDPRLDINAKQAAGCGTRIGVASVTIDPEQGT